VARAAAFAARPNADGGMPLSPGGASNARSTAWAIQALVAAGRDPARVRRRGARSPLAYVRSLHGALGRRALLAHKLPITGLGHGAGAHRPRPQPISDPIRGIGCPIE
jgi:hypothetical protein